MTDEEITELAEQSGGENINGNLFYMCKGDLKIFTHSVRLAESEACAKLCDSVVINCDAGLDDDTGYGRIAADECATLIRARSNKEG